MIPFWTQLLQIPAKLLHFGAKFLQNSCILTPHKAWFDAILWVECRKCRNFLQHIGPEPKKKKKKKKRSSQVIREKLLQFLQMASGREKNSCIVKYFPCNSCKWRQDAKKIPAGLYSNSVGTKWPAAVDYGRFRDASCLSFETWFWDWHSYNTFSPICKDKQLLNWWSEQNFFGRIRLQIFRRWASCKLVNCAWRISVASRSIRFCLA